MKIPNTFQLNVMQHRTLLQARINEFLQVNQLHPTRVDDMTVAQLIKAHVSDLLMPNTTLTRVDAICMAEFGVGNGIGWYARGTEGVHPRNVQATRFFHRDILDATLWDIEEAIFYHAKAPSNWVWDIGMGPWGAMIVVPVMPVTVEPKPVSVAPKILCGAVKQVRGTPYKEIDVRYIPATLEQDDDPNAYILKQMHQHSQPTYRRTPSVKEHAVISSDIRGHIEQLIRERVNYVEKGRYE